MSATRTEQDSMGTMTVPADALYGAQTARARDNFTISGVGFPRPFLRALGMVKEHAAKVNRELGLLDERIALEVASAWQTEEQLPGRPTVAEEVEGLSAVIGEKLAAGRVAHLLGYPLPQDVFGGGFIYAMDPTTVAVGLIMALDWKYGDLDPQKELERFRQHPFVAQQLEGGVTIASGARTIPEGGYYAMHVGDGGGWVVACSCNAVLFILLLTLDSFCFYQN